MRDLVAGIIALLLIFAALSLATTLQRHRRRRERRRDSERALGREIVAELPTAEELVLFSEDEVRFYYGDRGIDKDLIEAARLLVNGAPIAATGPRHRSRDRTPDPAPGVVEPSGGLARDRWDVAIDTATGTVVVECGDVRERVSQELARAVFDAVRRVVER